MISRNSVGTYRLGGFRQPLYESARWTCRPHRLNLVLWNIPCVPVYDAELLFEQRWHEDRLRFLAYAVNLKIFPEIGKKAQDTLSSPTLFRVGSLCGHTDGYFVERNNIYFCTFLIRSREASRLSSSLALNGV